MTYLSYGFNLFQPWADEVASGVMPYLVRSTNTHKRERVGVIATSNVDEIWLKTADKRWVDKTMKNLGIGIIGSIEIILTAF